MDQQVIVKDIDSLLLPFLGAEDEYLSEKFLAALIHEHAEPLIIKIIKSKLRVSLSHAQGSQQNQDALEIAGDVCAQIISELRSLKASPQRRPISDFPNYVAIKAYSACADYFREKNPLRWRLRDLLRHHLKQNQKFALWQGEDRRWLCGLRAWVDGKSPRSGVDQLPQLLSDPLSLLNGSGLSARGAQHLTPPHLLSLIFECVGHPIEFNNLVTIAAGVWSIKDQPTSSYSHDSKIGESLADGAASIETTIEQRLYLQQLWKEVCELPALQRCALLLNLRDAQGGSVIFFVPYLGIASREEIASALSMSVERLAQVWTELPLDDTSIARLLGATRQQVINLRKTARERLTRRMKAIEKNDGSNK
jgi:hypothetical protein